MLVVDDPRRVRPMNTEDPPKRTSSGPRVLARTYGRPERLQARRSSRGWYATADVAMKPFTVRRAKTDTEYSYFSCYNR